MPSSMSAMKCLGSTAGLLAVLLASRASAAQPRPPERIAMLTMSPGDHPFARFGHNAILVEWPRRKVVYNFGTFAFRGLDGIHDFLAGRFRYWLSVAPLSHTLRTYAAENRSVVAQYLNLDDRERLDLASALAVNARPENRYYDYDYYYDNCSTRVRDVVDRTLQGELSRGIRGPGRFSFRGHTLRLTADTLWLYFGLDLALGQATDRSITRWNELFIPGELHDALSTARRQRDGVAIPLVRAEELLLGANRPPVRSRPPSWAGGFAAVGLVLGGVFVVLGRLGATRRDARIAFALGTAFIGFWLGLLGATFAGFWLFTKHWAAHFNFNLLLCTPWALALAITSLGLVARRPRSSEWSRRLILASAIASLLALLLCIVLPAPLNQDVSRSAALFTPLWLGLYVGTDLLLERGSVERLWRRAGALRRQSRTTS